MMIKVKIAESSPQMLHHAKPGTDCDLGDRRRYFAFNQVLVGYSFWMRKDEYSTAEYCKMAGAVDRINEIYNVKFLIIDDGRYYEIGRIQ